MKKSFLLVIFICNIILFSNVAFAKQDFVDGEDINIRYSSASDYIKLHPNDAQAHYNLAVILKKMGKNDLAIEEFQKAYDLKNENVKNNKLINSQAQDYIDIADLMYKNDNLASAIDYYIYALESSPDSDFCCYKLSQIYEKLGKYNEAYEYINKAKLINPANLKYTYISDNLALKITDENKIKSEKFDDKYYLSQALSYINIDEFPKGRKFLEKAIELNPKSYIAFNNLGYVNYFEKKYDDAIKDYLIAISLKKDYSQAYYNLAIVYKEINDETNFIINISKSIELDNKFYQAYYTRATYYMSINQAEKAKADYENVIKIIPSHFESLLALARLASSNENYDEANNFANKASEISPDNSSAYIALADIYNLTGRNQDSLFYYKKALKNEANNKQLLQKMGKLYIELNEFKNASNIFKKLIAMSPLNDEYYNYLGISLFSLQDYHNAAEAFKIASKYDPVRSIYHYNLSQCYQKIDLQDKSIDEFQKAIQVKPVSINDYKDLAKIFFDRKMYKYCANVLNEAILNYPDEKYFYVKLSKVYLISGNETDSNKVLSSFKRINNNNQSY